MRSSRGAATDALDLGYEGLRLRVRSADPAQRAWLAEFVAPSFDLDDSGAAEVEIALIEDGSIFRRQLALGPVADGSLVDCFALDSRVVQLPRWHAAGYGHAAYDEAYGVFYQMSPDGRRVTLLAAASGRRVRTPLMRVARELAMHHGITAEAVFLHAAAFAVGGRGVAIAGAKAAGKTTLLTYCLSHGATRYVANDRLWLSVGDQPPRLRGMPSVVTVRPRTLALIPALGERLRRLGCDQQQTLAELQRAAAPPLRRFRDGRYGMTPAQYCQLTRRAAQAGASPALLLFPQLSGQPGAFQLQRLTPDEVAVRLPDALLCAGSWRKTSELLYLRHRPVVPGEPALRQRCRVLADQIPTFLLTLGTDAYRTDALAQEILQRAVD